ncbi:MAG TPA: hypothetical protein VFG07_05565 [Thermoplasmata archaeon]|nr:hypothetical protein [Thermoplasmata archaeon]
MPPSIAEVATVIAAIALLASSGIAGGLANPEPHGEGRVTSLLTPLVIPSTTIFLNRSQPSGTYVGEFVSLNNSSTPTRLPVALTVVASSCRWVSVLNTTTRVDSFHSVLYAEVTVGNNTGTVLAGIATTTFKVCGGQAAFVDFTYWTFTDYGFAAPSLGLKSNLTLVWFQFAGHAKAFVNRTFPIGGGFSVSLQMGTNESFEVDFPKVATGAASCNSIGACTTPSWTFSTAAIGNPATNSSLVPQLTFYQPTSASFQNWTAVYVETNASSTTSSGFFFVPTVNFLTLVFVDFWWAWVLLVLALVVVAAVWNGGRRRRR